MSHLVQVTRASGILSSSQAILSITNFSSSPLVLYQGNMSSNRHSPRLSSSSLPTSPLLGVWNLCSGLGSIVDTVSKDTEDTAHSCILSVYFQTTFSNCTGRGVRSATGLGWLRFGMFHHPAWAVGSYSVSKSSLHK